jgi:glycosyltransferase involved in cell wall biosynthesis
MTVVFAIKSLSTLGGGAERVFVQIVNGLAARGRDIRIVTFEPSDASSFYPVNKDIPRLDLALKANALRHSVALRRSLLSLHPRLVVAFMPSSYVPISFSLFGSGVPVIASEHNVPENYRKNFAKWGLLNCSALATARYTAVSEQMRQSYPRWIRRKMVVMANPVEKPNGAFAEVAGMASGKRLLAVGRLHPQKDHVTLIGAFAEIANDFPDWHLRILGEGNERNRLEAEVAKLGIAERVQLPGAVSNMSEEYASAQLYVIPSLYESQGLATVEAMAHGLPAVGFADCPGTNQIIAHGKTGLLVASEPTRQGALKNALAMLMENDALRRSLAKNALAEAHGPALEDVLDGWDTLVIPQGDRTFAGRGRD